MIKINDVAKLSGVTVRTLHYYDEIGLLKPSAITNAGYRLYGENELKALQQILFFRELDFPLEKIKEIMNNANFDKSEALKMHRLLLIKKRDRLNSLIELAEKAIKGENEMSFKQFSMEEIEKAKNEYSDEVRTLWGGSDEYRESVKKTSEYSEGDWRELHKGLTHIFEDFAEIRNGSPESKEAVRLVKRWQDYITEHFYKCSDDVLAGLGEIYVSDERFKRNIDSFGKGTAEFIYEAIKNYCAD